MKNLAPRHALDRLAGTWRGAGAGSYPGVAPFTYDEETTMVLEEDWSMLRVVQRTWLRGAEEKTGLHLEVGLVRAQRDGSLLYGCAQDSGRTEVMVGTPIARGDDELEIEWRTTAHANDPRLVRLGRVWRVRARELRYEAFMSTVRTPEYRRHLEATLTREG